MRRRLNLFLLCLVSCGRAAGPGMGEERGLCGDGCGEGLECWSERCVRPEGADCRAVGERLAALSLGNHAAREEREPVVRTWEAACEQERITRREGKCIVEAVDEDAIAVCPRPLVPELVGDPQGCARVGERAAQLMKGAEGRMRPIVKVIGEVPPTVTALCVDGRWGSDAKACVMGAASLEDAQRCIAMLDGGDRRALERRLTALVKRGTLVRTPAGTAAGDGRDPWE